MPRQLQGAARDVEAIDAPVEDVPDAVAARGMDPGDEVDVWTLESAEGAN